MKVWLLKLLQDVQKGNSILKSRNKKIKEKKERKKKREEHKIIRIIKAALWIYFTMHLHTTCFMLAEDSHTQVLTKAESLFTSLPWSTHISQ